MRTRVLLYACLAALAALALAAGLYLAQHREPEAGEPMEQEPAASTSSAAVAPGDTASLTGVVLNQYGEPIRGLRIELIDIGRTRGDRASGPRPPVPAATLTGPAGTFSFERLRAVEHELRTESSGRYADIRTIVHPGRESVTLTLEERVAVRVTGRVVDQSGTPIEGVRVVPLQLGRELPPTGSEGRFQFDMPLSAQSTAYTIRFLKEGYREASLVLAPDEIEGVPGIERTVTLRSQGPLVRLAGIVTDEYGAPVGGETVHLYSDGQRARYSAECDAQGNFEFTRVAASDDYRLSVSPAGPYRDYSIPQLDLTRARGSLGITLEQLANSPFEGRLVDDAGEGIAYQHLVLTSSLARGRSLDLFSGAGGEFYVESVPEGELRLRTLISPYILVEGLVHSSDASAHIEIPLDLGDDSLAGRVEDSDGRSIAGARVQLVGFRYKDLITSRVRWNSRTDERGEFRFDRLGNGPYQLEVSAPGYGAVSLTPDPREGWVRVVFAPPR